MDWNKFHTRLVVIIVSGFMLAVITLFPRMTEVELKANEAVEGIKEIGKILTGMEVLKTRLDANKERIERMDRNVQWMKDHWHEKNK